MARNDKSSKGGGGGSKYRPPKPIGDPRRDPGKPPPKPKPNYNPQKALAAIQQPAPNQPAALPNYNPQKALAATHQPFQMPTPTATPPKPKTRTPGPYNPFTINPYGADQAYNPFGVSPAPTPNLPGASSQYGPPKPAGYDEYASSLQNGPQYGPPAAPGGHNAYSPNAGFNTEEPTLIVSGGFVGPGGQAGDRYTPFYRGSGNHPRGSAGTPWGEAVLPPGAHPQFPMGATSPNSPNYTGRVPGLFDTRPRKPPVIPSAGGGGSAPTPSPEPFDYGNGGYGGGGGGGGGGGDNPQNIPPWYYGLLTWRF
jgi:hypothetical protein